MTTISVAGRATRVLDAGDGPVLVCSPGIASFVWDWAPLAQCLSATHRVIVVERPADERLGTEHRDAGRLDVALPGAATRPDAACPDVDRPNADRPDTTAGAPTVLEDDAAHLLNALDALGVNGSVTFVGHSFGAVVAEAAARMAPERASALVLLDGSLAEDGSAEPGTPRSGRRARLTTTTLRSRPVVAAWRVCGPTILTLTVPARRSLSRSIPGLRDEMASITVLETCLRELAAYSSCVRQLHALRTTSPLTRQLPTLVVAANGRLPRRTPTRWVRAVLRQARELAAEADVRTAVVERSGHFVMLDRPQRIADLILTLGSR